jgi:preprotein translocase subunit SecD
VTCDEQTPGPRAEHGLERDGRLEIEIFGRFVLVIDEAEREAEALARIAPFIASITPTGKRVVFGADEDSGALRSYVLTGEPIVTAVNVADAFPVRDEASGGASVRLRLDPEGTRRFADATREHIKRRIAIVVDDRVMSAPVVLTEIPGGQVSITMGMDDAAAQYRTAERLAAALRPVD